MILLWSLCSFLLTLPGCARQIEPPTIALITPLTTSEAWKAMHAGVYRAVSQAHARRYWNAPTHEHDYDRQIELVQQELDRGVRGIVLAPVHASALVPIVAQAARSGVPIVVVANSLATRISPPVATITSDETEAGRLGADAIANLVGGRGTVAIVGLDPYNSSTLLRADAFKARLERVHPGMRIVMRTFARDSSPRLLFLDADLRRIAEVDAVFSLSASATREVVAQLQQASEARRPAVVGCDQDSALYDDLRANRIDALIAEDTYRMGYLATEEILAALRSHRAPESKVLAPMLITQANLDSPQAQQILKPYGGFDR
ncbi:MAG: substrate-binding domain-containing protein [Acidobacteriales bacterium]|nr:substrate-binding domain-containing protein [Terriglobales bacterium]